MIIELKREDKDRVVEFLKSNSIAYNSFSTSLECFVENEIIECEEAYGTFSQNSLKLISRNVRINAINHGVRAIKNAYYDKTQEYAKYLDMETIAFYTVSNSVSIELKGIIEGEFGISDGEFICVMGTITYVGKFTANEENEICVEVEGMIIPIREFVRV